METKKEKLEKTLEKLSNRYLKSTKELTEQPESKILKKRQKRFRYRRNKKERIKKRNEDQSEKNKSQNNDLNVNK